MVNNDLTPEQRTRALYAHRINSVFRRLANEHPRQWEGVSISDGRLINATKRQVGLLTDILKNELGDPEIAIGNIALCTKPISPTPYGQQSFVTYVLNILDEFYAGHRSGGGRSQPGFRRAMEARYHGGEIIK